MDPSLPSSKRRVEPLEPPPDLGPGPSDEWGIRQGISEDPTVAFRDDARIKKEDGSSVLSRPDQSSESLFEPECSQRDEIAVEGASTPRLDRFHPRLDNRLGGYPEGNLLQDQSAERVSGHIDSLPEGGGSEKDPPPGPDKVGEQLSSRGLPVHEEGPPISPIIPQVTRDRPESGVRGEEDEEPSIRNGGHLADDLSGRFLEWRPRVVRR